MKDEKDDHEEGGAGSVIRCLNMSLEENYGVVKEVPSRRRRRITE